MHHHRSKKILLYFFLFLFIGTLNNKNLKNFNFSEINEIVVSGLDEKDNNELKNSLEIFRFKNLFLINEFNIRKIINSNNLVENFSVFKQYPSSLNIKVDITKFVAEVKKDGDNFLLGTNGKLIKSTNIKNDIPLIFGNFKNRDFFKLKSAIEDTSFDYYKIKNLFFFQSGRWDIETNTGLIIKLPKDNIKLSLERTIKFLKKNHKKKINIIDLRQQNQIIINGNQD